MYPKRSHHMSETHGGFSLKGIWQRLCEEFSYYTKRPWSLGEVGAFWDTVEEYDDINETLCEYTYFRRFTNSFELAKEYLSRDDYDLLDIQARSGKGSLFWHEKKKIRSTVCVDFSDYLISLAKKRLSENNLPYDSIKIEHCELPFSDKTFNLIGCYETIEHIYDYRSFFSELCRVLSDDGILIVTCPNILWEPVHWLTAIIGINHSEGPHRFLTRGQLLRLFKKNNMKILKENATIVLPFKNKISQRIDAYLEKYLPFSIIIRLALRRTFILQSPAT